MPNVNPPADEATAQGDDALVFRPEGGGEVRIGPRLTAPTQPDPCSFRFGIVTDDTGRRFAGYLWETGGLPSAREDAQDAPAAIAAVLAPQPGQPPASQMEYKTAGPSRLAGRRALAVYTL